MRAYKVASSEQVNNLGLISKEENPSIDFINGSNKTDTNLDTQGKVMEDPMKIRRSHTLLPRLKKNTSERDMFEYSQKHSSVVIADMMSPPDYNKRVHDTLLTGKNEERVYDNTPEPVESETNLLKKKSNSVSNLDMKRLQYGVSSISINAEPNNLDDLMEASDPDVKAKNKGLNRIPSYHDAMVLSNKLQNSGVEVRDLPPVYNPQWDVDYEENNDITKLPRSKGNSTDNLSKNNSYSDLSSLERNQARNNRVARFQLGVSMTPINTGGEVSNMSREPSEKNLNQK
mgnify:FL=1